MVPTDWNPRKVYDRIAEVCAGAAGEHAGRVRAFVARWVRERAVIEFKLSAVHAVAVKPVVGTGEDVAVRGGGGRASGHLATR